MRCYVCERKVLTNNPRYIPLCGRCKGKAQEKERPPLGVYPRFLHDEKRMEHIAEAIERFTAVGKAVPLEWIEEYDELAERVQKRKVVRE